MADPAGGGWSSQTGRSSQTSSHNWYACRSTLTQYCARIDCEMLLETRNSPLLQFNINNYNIFAVRLKLSETLHSLT